MGLDIIIKKNPFAKFSIESLDRRTGISLSMLEWESFFFEELGAGTPAPFIEGEDIIVFDDCRKQAFIGPLSKYPLLSRIHDYYQDTIFLPDEIDQLLVECLSVERPLNSDLASEFLDKIIFVSREALESNSGLFLASD